jgi:hypothetical protein
VWLYSRTYVLNRTYHNSAADRDDTGIGALTKHVLQPGRHLISRKMVLLKCLWRVYFSWFHRQPLAVAQGAFNPLVFALPNSIRGQRNLSCHSISPYWFPVEQNRRHLLYFTKWGYFEFLITLTRMPAVFPPGEGPLRVIEVRKIHSHAKQNTELACVLTVKETNSEELIPFCVPQRSSSIVSAVSQVHVNWQTTAWGQVACFPMCMMVMGDRFLQFVFETPVTASVARAWLDGWIM